MYTNKEIWRVTYPIFLGLLAQNVINVTDTAFLGRVGEVALGAAAMGGLLYICVYTIAFGFSVGSQILIARRNGEGNYRAVGPIMWQGTAFSFGMAVCLLILMYFSAAPLIRLLITSDSIYGATYEFFTWRIWGFLFAFVNVMFRGLYIGITRTKVLTMNAVVMALVNVVLDYALVFGELGLPEMGVRGAALASVIAEASSLLFFLLYTYYKVDLKKYGLNRFGQFDLSMVLRILRISCFTMVQYFLAMAIWFVFFMALERLGQRQLAVANIVRSVYVVLLIPVQALSTTANTLVSNLIGAGGSSGVVTLLHKISRMSFLIMVVCVGLCVAFPGSILSVYTNEEALLVESVSALYVVCGAMLIASLANVYFNGISGTGNTQAALVLEVFVQVFYALYIIVVGMVIQAPVDVCFTTEVIYYVLMLGSSLIYLKKAKWQNKMIGAY
ncbi:MATE family efflux transporter [Phocaeicola plebeius]|uniref:MATE family efflux transporter n=1 Tax=Phocaeicola plebeius TaxID=310297 RepID=UPI003AB8FD05